MNVEALTPLVATIAYIPLYIILSINRPWQKQHKLLLLVLVSAMLWSASTFLLRSDFFVEYRIQTFQIVICAGLWFVVQTYWFFRSLIGNSGGVGLWIGYGSLLIVAVASILGYMPQSISFTDKGIAPDFGLWVIAIVPPGLVLSALFLYPAIRKFRSPIRPEERNLLYYMFLSIGILVVFSLVSLTPLGIKFPISHVGNLFTAGILTYVVLRHRLLSIEFIARRGLAWAGLTAIGMSIYILLYLTNRLLFSLELENSILAFNALAVILTFLIIYLLRDVLIRRVDKLFYRGRYEYRRKLLDFASHRGVSASSLSEFSRELLVPLAKILNCQRLYLLLPESNNIDFTVHFTEPQQEKTFPLTIRHDSPVLKWLEHESRYLTRKDLDILPEFRSLWGSERAEFTASDLELFFPIVSRNNLVGILALAKKISGSYSVHDMDLVSSTINQLAMSLEKEYLQEQLKRNEQELSLVNRLALVISSSLNIQDTYDTFVLELKKAVDADLVMITSMQGDNLYLKAFSSEASTDEQMVEGEPFKGTTYQWVAKHKKVKVEPDLSKNKEFWMSREYLKLGIRSTVYIPLAVKGKTIGFMLIGSNKANAYGANQIHILERLAPQISVSVENSQLYTRVERQARIDDLTGLFNRRHFDTYLKQEIDLNSRYGGMLSLILLDLDYFKAYNDQEGHLAGDKVLVEVGQIIKQSIRSSDEVFRYGGDEFAIVLPRTTTDEAFIIAKRVRAQIASQMADKHINMTASLGLASWPNDGITKDEIIAAADTTLYYAKQTGGDRACIVSDMLTLRSMTRSFSSGTEDDREALSIVHALAAAIEAKDKYTYGHSRKVNKYSVALAEARGLPSGRVTIVSTAALLHDIGKIGISDEILNKTGKLSSKEWEMIKSHAELSATIVGHVPSLTPCLAAIRHHHERWDGSGYPMGLQGESIPIEARILGIADAFDSMTSDRPYRRSLSYAEAVEQLKRGAGSQFDPNLVDLFLPIALAITSDRSTVSPKPV